MTDFRMIESFDYYNGTGTTNGGMTSIWTPGGSGEVELATGRFGSGQRCRLGDITGGTRYLDRAVPGGSIGPDFSIGFAYSQDTNGNSQLFYMRRGGATGTEQLNIRTNAAFGFDLYLNNTLLGSTDPSLYIGNDEDEWLWIDLFGTLSTTSGTVELWVNGEQQIVFTGVTSNGAATFDHILIRCPDGSGSSNWANFDDLLISDVNARIGEARIDYKPVDGDTADKDFTPSTGSDNYAVLDEIPISVTDYVTASTLGDRDVYSVENLAADTSTILAVQPLVMLDKTDAGAREVELQGISNGTDDSLVIVPTTTATIKYGSSMGVDPDTSMPWSYGGFNALQLGIEVTT